MQFPPGYSFDFTKKRAALHFPNLNFDQHFTFTSAKGDDYNCAAWAVEIIDEWIQFKDENGHLDVSLKRYIDYYEKHGFVKCDNQDFEEGWIKIVIYADDKNEFTHVARQLPNGKWTSKLGDWEDIEHESPQVLAGKSYGKPTVVMGKKV